MGSNNVRKYMCTTLLPKIIETIRGVKIASASHDCSIDVGRVGEEALDFALGVRWENSNVPWAKIRASKVKEQPRSPSEYKDRVLTKPNSRGMSAMISDGRVVIS